MYFDGEKDGLYSKCPGCGSYEREPECGHKNLASTILKPEEQDKIRRPVFDGPVASEPCFKITYRFDTVQDPYLLRGRTANERGYILEDDFEEAGLGFEWHDEEDLVQDCAEAVKPLNYNGGEWSELTLALIMTSQPLSCLRDSFRPLISREDQSLNRGKDRDGSAATSSFAYLTLYQRSEATG